ncbi:MAG: ATP-binding cassette domain-containing protein [Rhodobacteraceae bacterium]|nr:ATP-binding cassette domain-containing protein [Paracoccaceae bacterium]
MKPLLEVTGLSKHYPVRTKLWKFRNLVAADDVSLTVQAGETLAIVGESGSGKSTVGKCILRLEAPTSGHVVLDGQPISELSEVEVRSLRAQMQMVYQDPLESLNPRHKVGKLVAEPLLLHGIVSRKEVRKRVSELFHLVGLGSEHIDRYAHTLSGGQQQRVGIARALATSPKLLVLDEPTSALDVSVEAQILNLLQDLQRRMKLAFLLISHDLAVVSMLADRVAVMYLGQIVETGPTRDILASGYHPYSRALVSATPVDHPHQRKVRIALDGEPTSPIDPPQHCRLEPRCPFALPVCREQVADLKQAEERRFTRCIRFNREHVNGSWDPDASVQPGIAKPRAG